MKRDDVLWLIEFLRRVTARGAIEEAQLVRLVGVLEQAVGLESSVS